MEHLPYLILKGLTLFLISLVKLSLMIIEMKDSSLITTLFVGFIGAITGFIGSYSFNVFTQSRMIDVEYDREIINGYKEVLSYTDSILDKWDEEYDNHDINARDEVVELQHIFHLKTLKLKHTTLTNKQNHLDSLMNEISITTYTHYRYGIRDYTEMDFFNSIQEFRNETQSFIMESNYYLNKKLIWFKK